jgi:tRNA-2-methylthio-N6-dimethylallyladenosine synthase
MTKKQKTYFIWVLGCQMNKSDAEKIEAILSNLGYLKTDSDKTADVVVVVACSIRQTAIDRIIGKSLHYQKRRQSGELITILTGCVLKEDKPRFNKAFDILLPIEDMNLIPEKLSALDPTGLTDYFEVMPKRESKFQAYVPIMTGCDNFCTFCVVPYTRGREKHRSAQSIIDECQDLVNRGYKEITLLGQNVNSYVDGDYDFPKLLKRIGEIDGDFWLRFTTSNPQDFSDDLIEVMKLGGPIVPYLHFAIQSGDDEILKRMNRRHNVKHYLGILDRARKEIPNLMISTDIIVGFSGETEGQFQNTVKLFERVCYDMAYISQYSVRAGTPSAKLMPDNVSKTDKVRRDKELNDVLAIYAKKNNEAYIGKTVRVLVEGRKRGRLYGKTDTYKTVYFENDKNLTGEFVNTDITAADSWSLSGKIV